MLLWTEELDSFTDWAKYQLSARIDQKLLFPSPSNCTIALPADICHIELCHVNKDHYEVPVTTDGSVSHIPPYIGDASTSAGSAIVLLR